jgi:hypothetical protein
VPTAEGTRIASVVSDTEARHGEIVENEWWITREIARARTSRC